MRKDYINIPNALSVSRGILMPVLFVFAIMDLRTVFLISYAIIGATDAFDGWIARTFNMKTEIGKKLDSAADVIFYVSSAWFLQRFFPQYLIPNRILLIVFFSLFFLSFVISGIKLHKPVMMHTFLLKLNGVLVYLAVIASFFFDTTYLIAAILFIYFAGFVEEIAIFLIYGDVDPDTPTVFSLIK